MPTSAAGTLARKVEKPARLFRLALGIDQDFRLGFDEIADELLGWQRLDIPNIE